MSLVTPGLDSSSSLIATRKGEYRNQQEVDWGSWIVNLLQQTRRRFGIGGQKNRDQGKKSGTNALDVPGGMIAENGSHEVLGIALAMTQS